LGLLEMTGLDIERLVRVEVIMDEVRSDLKDLIRKIDKIEVRVGETEDAIKTAKIGWRMLFTLGTGAMTLAGMVGALISKWLPFLGSLPK
jgi:hypothetical protein